MGGWHRTQPCRAPALVSSRGPVQVAWRTLREKRGGSKESGINSSRATTRNPACSPVTDWKEVETMDTSSLRLSRRRDLWLSFVRWFDSWAGLEYMRPDGPSRVDWVRGIPLIAV